MYKLVLPFLFVSVVYSACIVPTYIGKSTLTESEVNKSDAKIKNLLIVGVGSTASRLFLENLSAELIKRFTKSNIKCDFTYEGKIPRKSHINMDNIITDKYDSYLILTPNDTSYVNTNKSVAVFATPLPGGSGTGTVRGHQYIEEYNVELYIKNSSQNKVWEGQLKVDFDFANTDRYKLIAKGIFNKLVKNGFIVSP